MTQYTVAIKDIVREENLNCGNKARALSIMTSEDIRLPDGICITPDAYKEFITQTGLKGRILMELGRKDLKDMRWEELWDASLRIRNMFVRTPLYPSLREDIISGLPKPLQRKPVVIRSSSTAEDTQGTSFAGLHDSFVNVTGIDRILHHIKLVWASLWSDAALSYSKELSLDINNSAMSVLIQNMIVGTKSGIAFGEDPNDPKKAVIEAVYGLNKGLVDGDIEPDRWVVSGETGRIVSQHQSAHARYTTVTTEGTILKKKNLAGTRSPLLNKNEISEIFSTLTTIQNIFGSKQDIEWTFRRGLLYILQARPITVRSSRDNNKQRVWDLSLRRSIDNLNNLSEKIEKVYLPAMTKAANKLSGRDLNKKSDEELAQEIAERKKAFDYWRAIYWNEFIPFAHGFRLFGQVYNDRLSPEDPYEFVDILATSHLLSLERNRALESFAKDIFKSSQGLPRSDSDPVLNDRLEKFIEKFTGVSCDITKCQDEKETLLNIARQLLHKSPSKKNRPGGREKKKKLFLNSFSKKDRAYAENLLDIGRKSYRLRDDDNIYLGRFEGLLTEAIEESRKRLGRRCKDTYTCSNPEEVIRALHFRTYKPKAVKESTHKDSHIKVQARQLRGQPASRGIAEGTARVLSTAEDLGLVQNGEIVVCDAIDPNMTFVIPLVSAIVERRGGMLIHGAIIAREYGIPCVTGIPDATDLIKTGDYLTVDGYYGLVIVHDQKEAQEKRSAVHRLSTKKENIS